jgi:hydrogenase maturation protease
LARLGDSSVLIIGVGNETRGDDAVGLIVSRELKQRIGQNAIFVEENGDGSRLIDRWAQFDSVILVDATQSGSEPGKIHKFEAGKSPLPANLFQSSTHAFGVAQAIELARAMNQLPRLFVVYGVEGKCFDEGTSLSPMVERAAKELVDALAVEVVRHQSLISSPSQ